MAGIVIENLVKSYARPAAEQPLKVLDDLNLRVEEGELVTFFGPNGCGKTTLMKVLAGVEPHDGGRIAIDSLSPSAAKTALVFQNYADALMPWLTGWENVLFAYRFRKRRAEYVEARRRLESLLSQLHVTLPLERYPYEMSGGQQQLLSIFRTLVYRPDVILMDEPFSALDFQTRAFMQDTLLDAWHLERMTILFVSHDIEEALYLADRLVLLGPLPATIKAVVPVNLERPRHRDILTSEKFFRLKGECLRLFMGSQK